MKNDTLKQLATLSETDPRILNRIASRMFVTIRTVERWANGERAPGKAKLFQLQRILDSYKTI